MDKHHDMIIRMVIEIQEGSYEGAEEWYRSQPLPGFGGLTAEQLVKQGEAKGVIEHLKAVAVNGYS